MKEHLLVVFSRGFIGLSTPGLNKETNKKTVADQLIDIRYRADTKTEDKMEVYNVNITKMYTAMIDGTYHGNSITFNKAIIVEALRNFGSVNLLDWINLQKTSRYFTSNHQKFLLDTLNFIVTGKRKTTIRTWEIILKRKTVDDVESVSNNKEFDSKILSFLNSIASDGNPISSNLTRIIPEWFSHRGGNEDLLLTLNIIFGKELNT